MKKTFAMIAALMLAVLMVLPCFALETVSTDMANAYKDIPAAYANATHITFGDFWADGATNARCGESNGYKYVYLKADDKGDMVIKFTVTEDAIYDFGFTMMPWKKSVLRATDFFVDDGDRVRIAFDYVDEDQANIYQYYTGYQCVLTAGEHTMTLSLPSDFDDTNVKTLYMIDFFYISEPLPEGADDEAADETADEAAAETADEAAAAEAPKAAKTADVTVVMALVSAITAAGAVVCKKRK